MKDFGMPVRGKNRGISIADKCWKRSQSPRRRVVVGYRGVAAKISHLVVIKSTLRFCLGRWPRHQCKLCKTLYAAPLTDGHNAIRDIGRHRLAAMSSRRRDGLMLLTAVGPAAGR
jgi:hypothetical protein